MIDRSGEKAQLAEAAAAEARQIAAARQRLASGARTRLSDLGALDPMEFALFLDLLGEALAIKLGVDEAVDVTSSDGTMRVALEPIADGQTATIVTSTGRFSGRDHYLTIRDLLRAGDADADPDRATSGRDGAKPGRDGDTKEREEIAAERILNSAVTA